MTMHLERSFVLRLLLALTGVFLVVDQAVVGRVLESPAYRTSQLQNAVLGDEDNNFKKSWQINKKSDVFPFYQGGDMVLDEELDKMKNRNENSNNERRRTRRAIVNNDKILWPDGIVPYVIDPKLDDKRRNLINLSFEHIMNYTCILFRPKTDRDVDYIRYIYAGECWSKSVGRMGGMQEISLGDGCDQLGRVVHETVHALGFYHEQNRMDRDRYIRVIKKNIDRRALGQFIKEKTASRGYAYDYHSIMHYGTDDYTDNGQKTIQLIGIGKKMGFKIGQRSRLSDIDIAQLRDIYNCNRKEAEKQSCRPGWVKFRSSCYGFFDHEPVPFFPASRTCRSLNSRLVIIDDNEEQSFLISRLKDGVPFADRWRTGGLRLVPSGEFVWYLAGSRGRHRNMTYTAWPINENITEERTSLVLAAMNTTRTVGGNDTQTALSFAWKTEKIGSRNASENHSFPFICEARAQIKCFENKEPRGRDYRGNLTYTSEGITCQRWSRRYPHNHTIEQNTDEGIGDHNFCRNPNGMRLRPWCFTLLKNVLWQYCDVPVCNKVIRRK